MFYDKTDALSGWAIRPCLHPGTSRFGHCALLACHTSPGSVLVQANKTCTSWHHNEAHFSSCACQQQGLPTSHACMHRAPVHPLLWHAAPCSVLTAWGTPCQRACTYVFWLGMVAAAPHQPWLPRTQHGGAPAQQSQQHIMHKSSMRWFHLHTLSHPPWLQNCKPVTNASPEHKTLSPSSQG